ncbi:MAG: DUF1565 domain-containing protein, partial [Bacteroidales bacterium]|nr:DUF1565 domain-containing protein [Bacteroidales bacterium]
MKRNFTLITLFMSMIFALHAQVQEIYVSPQGDDNADGSALTPVRTLSHALQISGDDGTIIRMSSGNYNEAGPLELRSNLTIEGGFDGSWQPDSVGTHITVQHIEYVGDYSQKIGLRSDNDTNWTLRRLSLAVLSATEAERSSSGKGATVYALYIAGNSSGNKLEECHLESGNGGDGLAGQSGTAGSSGSNGTSGGDGGLSPVTNSGDEEGTGGSGAGSGLRGGGAGGDGGEGGEGFGYSGDAGSRGVTGGNGSGGAGGSGGSSVSAGHNGQNGSMGSTGPNGTLTEAHPTYTWTEYFIPADRGNNGSDGFGGGGGGGGSGG